MRSSSHLSYPYVFAHAGAWYMVPESAQDRRVALYRALDVPYEWERVATLIDGVATRQHDPATRRSLVVILHA